MADDKITRRELLGRGLRIGGVALTGGVLGVLGLRGHGETVWQIDPELCTHCGLCATSCVLTPSAVKCVHAYAMCGYCDLCFGFFEDNPSSLDTGAENQRCPTGALQRSYVDDPYYQYVIDEPLCIGCAKCVKGCTAFGNGSLFLQIRHDRCTHCNQCAIASACPAKAITRVPIGQPYLLKTRRRGE